MPFSLTKARARTGASLPRSETAYIALWALWPPYTAHTERHADTVMSATGGHVSIVHNAATCHGRVLKSQLIGLEKVSVEVSHEERKACAAEAIARTPSLL